MPDLENYLDYDKLVEMLKSSGRDFDMEKIDQAYQLAFEYMATKKDNLVFRIFCIQCL